MNYQEHKTFFDGRHSKKAAHRNYKDRTKVTMDGENVVLTYGYRSWVACKIVLQPDDHYRVYMDNWNQAGTVRIGKLTGLTLFSHKQETLKEDKRIWTGINMSVPWVNGALYYGTQPAEPEKHVDYKRGFDPVKRLEIQRQIRDLSKAARVLAVMDAYSTEKTPWNGFEYAYEHEIMLSNRDGATSELIDLICRRQVNDAKNDWYYNRRPWNTLAGESFDLHAEQKKKRINAVKTALTRFTKAYYAQADAYTWTEVAP